MKRFKVFATTSCLGLALAAVPAIAQNDPAQPSQDQQKQKDQASQTQTEAKATPDDQNQANKSAADQNQLPKTASPMPLVGLAGLLSLGAAGVLRATRR